MSDSRHPESAATDAKSPATDTGRPAADDSKSTGDTAERLAELEDRVTELEAATQALRGYVGGVRAVDEEIERRANAALAAVNRLEGDEDRKRITATEDATDEGTTTDRTIDKFGERR